MSWTDKIGMMMSRPGAENVQKDDVPWWMRYGGRGLGIFGGFMAIFMGLLACTGIFMFEVTSVLAGVWQMLAGFLVMVSEAPCCCVCIDYVQVLSDKLETRPYWNKAVLYVGLALPPFFLAITNFSTWLGSGLIFATGVVYGMMALGKKASVEEMRTSAANLEAGMAGPTTTAPRAKLVAHELPVSFTGAPERH